MAPELLWDEEYSYGIDIFSLGMVFLEVKKKKGGREDVCMC
jgi:serine/threonine protein kinase